VGDSLFATPAIRFLRQQRPETRLTMVVKWDVRNLFETNPHLDRLVHYRNNAFWRGMAKWRILRGAPYRAVFFFHVGDEVNDLIRGVKHERLYCVQALNNLPAHAKRCKIYPAENRQWEDFAAMVAQEVGGSATDFEFELPLAAASREQAQAYYDRLAPVSGPRVGLQLGGSHLGKCWPPERYAALAEHILKGYGGRIFVNTVAREQGLLERFMEKVEPELRERCHPLPRTSLNGMAALLQGLDLFISNDTGPLHVALAQNRPVIALKAHDDQTYAYTLPRETPLRRCLFVRTNVQTSGPEYKKSHRAMECITLEAVWTVTEEVLAQIGFRKIGPSAEVRAK
jgi:ADP-heptose:LPS heptosyltransferase